MQNIRNGVSEVIITRLTTYLRCLYISKKNNIKIIKSSDISKLCGIKSSVVRKDFTQFGAFGIKGKGYDIEKLINKLRKILGIERKKNVALIGVGNLGTALLKYQGFIDANFHFIGAFDNNSQKIGQSVNGVKIYDVKDLEIFIKKNSIAIIILTIPASAVETIFDKIDHTNIKGILNFTSAILPCEEKKIYIRNIDLSRELELISFCMKKCLKKEA